MANDEPEVRFIAWENPPVTTTEDLRETLAANPGDWARVSVCKSEHTARIVAETIRSWTAPATAEHPHGAGAFQSRVRPLEGHPRHRGVWARYVDSQNTDDGAGE